MMDLIFSNKGNGKTTLIAKIANSKRTRKKYDYVLCNVPIANTYRIDVKDIGRVHMENCLLIIDESAIEFPNTTPLKEYQKSFMRLSRHYRVDIIFVSQSWEDINVVIRRLYDRIFFLKKSLLFPQISYLRPIKKTLGIDENTKQIIDEYSFKPNIPFLITKYFYRPLYYKYFNSYDAPQLQSIVFEYWGDDNYTPLYKTIFKRLKGLFVNLDDVIEDETERSIDHDHENDLQDVS